MFQRQLITKITSSLAAMSIAAVPTLSFAKLQDGRFPFQEQSFRVRFQNGFFKVGSNLFEDIMRSAKLIDDSNTIRVRDRYGNLNFVQYNDLKTSLKMEENRLIAAVKIDISNARFYSKENPSCSVTMYGPLAFATVMDLTQQGRISVDIPAHLFEGRNLQVEKHNCGILADLFAGPDTIRNMLKDGLKAQFGEMLNKQEFKMVKESNMDAALRQARVFLNIPSDTSLNKQTESNFQVAVGVRGSLAGANDPREGLRVIAANSPYLSGLGLEWSLDTGIEARSQNIYDREFDAEKPANRESWPEWGRSAYAKTGKPVNFDAAVMLRGSFLRSLFTSLYQAGFFNLQIQDSLVDKSALKLNPAAWNELFQITLPNGQRLTKANYKDLRFETIMASAPNVRIRDSKAIELVIPDLTVKVNAQAKNSNMFEVLQFKARFHLLAIPEMNEDGELTLNVNESPIEDFQIISRSGVGKNISNADIEKRLDQTVIAVLSKAKIEIPLLKGRKITIPYMGIDGDRNNGSEALAIYLKVK